MNSSVWGADFFLFVPPILFITIFLLYFPMPILNAVQSPLFKHTSFLINLFHYTMFQLLVPHWPAIILELLFPCNYDNKISSHDFKFCAFIDFAAVSIWLDGFIVAVPLFSFFCFHDCLVSKHPRWQDEICTIHNLLKSWPLRDEMMSHLFPWLDLTLKK